MIIIFKKMSPLIFLKEKKYLFDKLEIPQMEFTVQQKITFLDFLWR